MLKRTRGVAAVGTAALLMLGFAGCTLGGDGPTPSSSSTSVAPGVEPTGKGEPTPTPSPVEAVLSYAGVDIDGTTVSAAGYVQGILENDGQCSFTFTGLGDPVVVTSMGISDSSTTSCGSVSVPIGQLPSGSWSVTLSYSSAEVPSATSDALAVEVP